MSYRLSMADLGEFICLDKNKTKGQNISTFKDKIYYSNVEESIITDEISIVKWELDTKEDLEISGEYSSESLNIRIALDGIINNYEQNTNINTSINKNEIASVYTKNIKGVEYYKKNTYNKSLEIFLKDSFFDKYLPKYGNDILNNSTKIDNYKILNKKKMDYNTLICAQNLYNSLFENELEQIRIQSLVLDLIYNEIKSLISFSKKDKEETQVKFSEYDLDALKKAKELLLLNMENPPSITELSKLVKLNEFKLKYGFKKFFNSTPYSLLLEYRMDKAKQMLASSDYNVNEISSMVGYKQSSNFTKAFYKKFGILPKDIMKSRKYYY